jgi:tetratricopeptide (TPR) repeat protein
MLCSSLVSNLVQKPLPRKSADTPSNNKVKNRLLTGCNNRYPQAFGLAGPRLPDNHYFFRHHRHSRKSMQLKKKQIGGILIGFLVITWLVASLSLVIFIKKKKGYEAVKFTDIALPWNWRDVQPKWGDYFIRQGIEQQALGEWQKAYHFIRIGVSKSPQNLEGRLALADLLFQANDVTQAVSTLEAGLEFAGNNEAFWAKMVSFLQYYQADKQIIRILQRALEDDLLPESETQNARSSLAKALYHQAEFEEALVTLGNDPAIANQIIRSQIYWDQALESLAIQHLESLNQMFPNQREIVPLLTRFYKESGATEKALQLSKTAYFNNPYSIGASVNYFRTLGSNADSEIDRFLERVPEIYENQDALFLLANYLAEAGMYEKLDSIISKSSIEFQSAAMVWFLKIESLINGGQHQRAIKLLESVPDSFNQLIPLHRILFHSLSLTVNFALGADDKAKISMQQLFTSGHIRPATLLRLAKKLIEIQKPFEAERVLQFLLKQNPGNHSALCEKIRVDLMTGKTEQAIKLSRAMLENRAMPFALMKDLALDLGSDRQLFHPEGAALIREILDSMTPTDTQKFLEVL